MIQMARPRMGYSLVLVEEAESRRELPSRMPRVSSRMCRAGGRSQRKARIDHNDTTPDGSSKGAFAAGRAEDDAMICGRSGHNVTPGRVPP
jgi:hypothetical protein